MQHVIIGAGPAGVVAAETIRKADPSAKVTLIGNEPENPYSHGDPLLPCGTDTRRGYSLA